MQTNKETGITLVKSLVVKDSILAGDIVCNSITVKHTESDTKNSDYCIYFGEVLSEHRHRLYASKNNFIMLYPYSIRISHIAVVGMNFGEFGEPVIITIKSKNSKSITITNWPKVEDLDDIRCTLLQTDETFEPGEPIIIEASIPRLNTQSAYLTVIIYHKQK